MAAASVVVIATIRPRSLPYARPYAIPKDTVMMNAKVHCPIEGQSRSWNTGFFPSTPSVVI